MARDALETRKRAPLTRQAVVAAATAVVDAEGVEALSMRRLGRELGVEAMAVYHYVPSRDALIDLVSDHVVDDLFAPEALIRPDDAWQDYLRRIAHGLRTLAGQHPRLFTLISTHPPAVAWVRPPLRSLHWAEAFLAGCQQHGFDDTEAVYAYRAFTAFLVGHLLLDLPATDIDTTPRRSPGPDLDQHPTLSRLASLLEDDQGAQEFEDSLTNLLARLEQRRGSTQRHRRDRSRP